MKKPPKKFSEQDLIKTVWKEMKSQERNNPALALIHRQLGHRNSATILLGLTGGIASGKTLVGSLLKQRKIPVIDADEVAREVVKPKREAYRLIVDAFGEGILGEDKTINRERLGELVFAHEEKRKLLEEITHPEILQEIGKKVRVYEKKKARVVVIDAALLFESSLHLAMDKTLLVTCNPEVQLKRLKARDHLTDLEAWQRILAQMPTPEKIKKADFVVDNSKDKAATEQQLLNVLKKLTG